MQLIAIYAVLTAWYEENNIPYEGIPVGTIKRSIANPDKISPSTGRQNQ